MLQQSGKGSLRHVLVIEKVLQLRGRSNIRLITPE